MALVVGGPGVVHALAGIVNASQNHWPMLVLAGSVESHQRSMGGFQEFEQVEAVRPYTKFAGGGLGGAERLPWIIEKAYRSAWYGRPGPTYVDLPADYIQTTIQREDIDFTIRSPIPPPPRSLPPPEVIAHAADLLRTARAPLLVVGKGAAYGRAEAVVRNFVSTFKVPFLPTPMGKGVIPDSHDLNTSAARSQALQGADVVILLGARLNWLLHFGAGKWSDNVRFIQVDVAPEELLNNNPRGVGLNGDIALTVSALTKELGSYKYNASESTYFKSIHEKSTQNETSAKEKEQSQKVPMSYQTAFAIIRDTLAPIDPFYVAEGANTMDIARSSFPCNNARGRLDAGTFATMGVGLGYVIAAATALPHSRRIVGIIGDSAFGFSAMEVETCVRYGLNTVVFVINNNGVYSGLEQSAYEKSKPLPTTALGFETRYDTLGTALGAKGILVRTPDELKKAAEEARKSTGVMVVNVLIEPGGVKKTVRHPIPILFLIPRLSDGSKAARKRQRSKVLNLLAVRLAFNSACYCIGQFHLMNHFVPVWYNSEVSVVIITRLETIPYSLNATY